MPARDRLRKTYVDTDHGQVHVRTAGAGARALLLLHWTPLSGRMYADVAPAFADRGWAVVAPDLLGYGRSDPRPNVWTIADWAQNCAEVMAGLGHESYAVLGGHNGASVAVELALAHPDRTTHLVLDGCAFLTPELKAAFGALAAAPRPAPSADGAHERLAFQRAAGLLKEYRPDYAVTAETIEDVWPAMIDYLETDFVSSGHVASAYALEDRLPLLTLPVLLLGAQKDTLAASFPHARSLLPQAQAHFFEGDHPLHDPARAQEYAGVVTAFLA